MGFDSSSLPPNLLRLMSEKDRKQLKQRGQLPEETMEKAEARNEKHLQAQCINLLRLRGVEVNVSRMDKAKTDRVDWPDFTFAVTGFDGYQTRVYACAIECKMPGKYLNAGQIAMRKKLTGSPNAWTCRVIRSLDELKMFLDGLGL